MNPLDLLLAALATCGTFVCETAAQELSYDLTNAIVDVEADFDPQGVKGEEGVSLPAEGMVPGVMAGRPRSPHT